MKDTIVVNLFGGPGTAKSIFCALIFARLKLNGVSCEMAREVVKDEIWKGNTYLLSNQQAIYSEQQKLVHALREKVDVVVTDAPLMNSILYDNIYNENVDIDFHRTVKNEFDRYNNMNFVLSRVMPYEKEGRHQNEQEAETVSAEVLDLLTKNGIPFKNFDAWEENANVIAREVLKKLNK